VKARAKRLDAAITNYAACKKELVVCLFECLKVRQWELEGKNKSAWTCEVAVKLGVSTSTAWNLEGVAALFGGLPEKDWREIPDENLVHLAKLESRGTTQKWLQAGKSLQPKELGIAVRKALGMEERRAVNVPKSQQQAFKELLEAISGHFEASQDKVFDALIGELQAIGANGWDERFPELRER
jgi:hypothetical protein